jgi:Fur family ferric uptake transcriptional regulator
MRYARFCRLIFNSAIAIRTLHPSEMPNRSSTSSDLKNIGLKATVPRLKVLEIFQRSTAQRGIRHMSAEDVYKALIAEHIDVGLATVYRVLTQFEQAGLLSRNHFEGGRAMFELNEGSHHDHLVCLTCGRVEEFVDSDIETRQQQVAAQRGFKLHDHALALYGECTKANCEYRPKE